LTAMRTSERACSWLVDRDVEETHGREKEDGSKCGPWGRRSDGESGDARAAQEGGAVDVASRTSEVMPGAVVLQYDEGERGDVKRGTYGLSDEEKNGVLNVMRDDLQECETDVTSLSRDIRGGRGRVGWSGGRVRMRGESVR
jgi:hypothetical protein